MSSTSDGSFYVVDNSVFNSVLVSQGSLSTAAPGIVGATAAAFGVVVRAGWKAIALTSDIDPCSWLEHLEHAFFADDRFDGFATVLTGRAAAGDPVVAMASAGHCRPLLVGSRVQVVTVDPRPPLGVLGGQVSRTTAVTVEPGQALMVYTDGLIEKSRVMLALPMSVSLCLGNARVMSPRCGTRFQSIVDFPLVV